MTMRTSSCFCWRIAFVTRTYASSSSGHTKAEVELKHRQSTTPAPRELEKAVGYPTPLLSLRHLLTNDMLQLSSHVRKLLQSRHPIVKTAKWLLGSGSLQSRGLTVLLVSKLFNTLRPDSERKELDHFGILPQQRALAEIAEIIHSAYVINLGIVNMKELGDSDDLLMTEEDMFLGNKIAILSGDYLLARACTGLAELHNNQVVGLVSDAIADMTEGYFLQKWLDTNSSAKNTDRDMLQNLLTVKPELKRALTSKDLHTNPRHTLQLCAFYLTHGSLVGRSCECSALVADLPTPLLSMTSSVAHSVAMAGLWNTPFIREKLSTSHALAYTTRALEELESFGHSDAKSLLQRYISCD